VKIFDRAQIVAALDEAAALAAVEDGFRRMHAGQAQLTAVGHLGFTEPPGDAHVKGAYLAGDPVFVIKVANSFYRNPARGLPSSHGFMAVMDATTGQLLGLLNDEGWLTDQRTAMAGAIAARAIARPRSRVLGIVGSGIQARLQARLIARLLGFETLLVWARDDGKAEALATELGGEAVSLPQLCARADLIVTTTPSTTPLLSLDMVRPGTRIVAVGADAPGKQELAVDLLAKARLVVDSRDQCVDHGDSGWAIRAGLVQAASLIELGDLLTTPRTFGDDEIVIADLTGVAVQDAQIAKTAWLALNA
jgi:ornithine cyclodeaminase